MPSTSTFPILRSKKDESRNTLCHHAVINVKNRKPHTTQFILCEMSRLSRTIEIETKFSSIGGKE